MGETGNQVWFYNIYGAACAEVELDVLTGNYIISRVDLLYDCGNRSAVLLLARTQLRLRV